MDSNKIKAIIFAIIATFVAIYLGINAATAQLDTVLWVVGGLTFIGCLALGRKIWLVIPFMAALNLSLRIPGQPSSLLLGQAIVLGFATLLFLMRKLPFRLAWTELEIWILLITLFVGQVYLRNPVGVNIFGNDTVGGKGYALYAIALASSLLLSGLKVPTIELKWILRVSIVGGILNTVISIIGYFVPVIGYYTGVTYKASDEANYEDFGTVIDTQAASRVGFLVDVANNVSLWISSFISPIRASFKPLWAVLVILAFAAATYSGFRNVMVSVGFTFVLGIAYRSGFSGLLIAVFGGIGGLALIAVINTMHPLPPNVQRSLTFLPGTWDDRYKRDAEGSSEWRFEIWREALLTERWIQNKWLGDGLGFSAAELNAQMSDRKGARAGISGFEAHREAILASGDYHSGPVSTIRIIGYVGLVAFLIAQIRLAVHAHRQIQRCRDTEWFPLALFLGIPLIWGPVFFIFIVGDFRGGSTSFLLAAGMIRLLENNLPLPAAVGRKRIPYNLSTSGLVSRSSQVVMGTKA